MVAVSSHTGAESPSTPPSRVRAQGQPGPVVGSGAREPWAGCDLGPAGWEGKRGNEIGPGCPQSGHGPWYLLDRLASNESKLNGGQATLAEAPSTSIK